MGENSLYRVTKANFIIKWKSTIYNVSIGFFISGYTSRFPKEKTKANKKNKKKKHRYGYLAKKGGDISENKISVNIPYSIVLVLYFGIH